MPQNKFCIAIAIEKSERIHPKFSDIGIKKMPKLFRIEKPINIIKQLTINTGVIKSSVFFKGNFYKSDLKY